jgi:hypothetical protein
MMYIFDPSECDQWTKNTYSDWARLAGYDLTKPVRGETCSRIPQHLLLYFDNTESRVEAKFFKPCPPPDYPLEYYL